MLADKTLTCDAILWAIAYAWCTDNLRVNKESLTQISTKLDEEVFDELQYGCVGGR